MALLLVGLVLAARDFCPFWPTMALIEEILFFLAGLIAGIRLPDLDLTIPGLSHRSAITHSCIPALVVWAVGFSPIAAGLALGFAILLVHAVRGGTLSVKLVWQYFA